MSKKSSEEKKDQGSFGRRQFLSSVMIGGAAVISLEAANAAPVESVSAPTDIAPTCKEGPKAVDSLSMASLFLYAVSYAPICAYQESVISSTFSLEQAYTKLINLADKLESEAPELKETSGMTKLKKDAQKGAESTKNINNLVNTREALLPAFINVTMTIANERELLKSAVELSGQQKSITLSPLAASTLRTLLQEIRKIYAQVQEANKRALELRSGTNDVYSAINRIKDQLSSIVSLLAANKSKKLSQGRSDDAVRQINQVIDQLAAIDSLYTDRLKSLPDESKERCIKLIGTNPPSEFLRDYLAGVKDMIAEETAMNNRKEGLPNTTEVATAHYASIGYWDLFYLLGEILTEPLIDDTYARRGYGAILLRPLLKYRGDKRISEFKQALPKLIPEGKFDSDDSKVDAAARKLNDLLSQRGS